MEKDDGSSNNKDQLSRSKWKVDGNALDETPDFECLDQAKYSNGLA
jgi:hypothetical protein